MLLALTTILNFYSVVYNSGFYVIFAVIKTNRNKTLVFCVKIVVIIINIDIWHR